MNIKCLTINHEFRHFRKIIIAVIKQAHKPAFNGVPGMALIQSEINRPQVVTAKCSEPQADTIKVGVKEVV